MQENISEGDTTWNLTSADYPDVFYGEGSQESLDFVIDGPELEINDSNFVYRTLAYERDGLPFIVWLGKNFNIVDNKTNNWYLSDLIVNENSNDDHFLTTVEPLSLPEGFAVTVLEIDIEGGKAWISVSKDGEELYSSVNKVGEEFIYMEDLNESSNEDNWVLKFNIETMFPGMNSIIVKINGLKLRSPDVVTIETPNNDLLDGFIITEFGTTGLQIKLDAGEKIKLKKGGVVNLICEMFRFRLDADGDVGGILKNTNPQGIWKDVTCSLDTNPICGLVTDLSEFVVVELIQNNNTPAGIDVEVPFDEVGVNLTFANVTKPGQTNVDISTEGPSIPAEYNMLGNYYDISTSADHVGNISVCIKYNYFGADDDNNFRILHYEDIGDEAYAYMQENISEGDTTWNLTAADYPDVFYGEGSQESLDFVIDGPELEINDSNFVYRTLAYERDGLPFIVWLGENFNIVDNKTNNWYLSDLIVNENSNDDHFLTTVEPLSLPEGFAVTVLEIDIEGGKAWISVSKDGEELYSSVRGEGEEFIYMEDLNESSNKDNWVLRFNIETMFPGMNSIIVKINGLKLRSPDVVTIETPNDDFLDGYIITEFGTTGLQIKLDAGERIKLNKGGVVNLICEMFKFGLDADGDVGGILKNTNPQGIWKDVTCSLDTNSICGLVTDLSEFVVVELIQNNNTPAGIDVEVPFDEVGVNLTFANVTF